jgi:hypothetical protein
LFDDTMKPMTSPDNGSMPAARGARRRGDGERISVLPANSVAVHGASPSAWLPSRFAPACAVSTRLAFAGNPAPNCRDCPELVVAEQHGVDPRRCPLRQRGPGQFLQLHVRQLIGAGRIEGRVGQQAKASISISAVGPPISVMDRS